jgi:nicotinamidase-related amidase
VLEYRGLGKTVDKLKTNLKTVPNVMTIRKPRDNGFKRTKLGRILRELNTETIIFMGINASACVLKTAYDARVRGYNIVTCRELIASSRDHDANLTYSGYWYEESGLLFKKTKMLLKCIK